MARAKVGCPLRRLVYLSDALMQSLICVVIMCVVCRHELSVMDCLHFDFCVEGVFDPTEPGPVQQRRDGCVGQGRSIP